MDVHVRRPLFSFYNAGSGTNQSNHMYKLGPLHEGKLADADFAAIRGDCEQNEFVRQVKQNLENLRQRVERLNAGLDGLPREDGEATGTEPINYLF